MSDYEALDIGVACNADASILGPNARIPTGRQIYHGLPFQIAGENGGNSVVAFGAGVADEPFDIPIGRSARTIVIAHRLLDSKIYDGDPVGRVVAEYVFHTDDGDSVVVPIRERFEIAVVPSAWGQLAFLAYPDQKDGLMPRYQGNWGSAGNRQTEATQAWPSAFYLWAWKNPNAAKPIRSMTVHPSGPRAYIGAITLGHLDEYPFNRAARRPVKIVLPKNEDAAKRFNLEVDVDRGSATYPYALPLASDDAFVDDSFRGWGEPQNPNASPSYVEIAATRSATVTIKQDGEELGSANWGELQDKKEVEPTPRLKMILVDEGRNWVKTTIVDDATGEPLPCRAHFRSPDGVPYQPHGHHSHVNSNNGTWHIDVGGDVRLGQITYAYVNGTCEGWLPRGDVIVDVARGYEYEPLRQKIRIEPGQQTLILRLKRFANMNAERYFSGDTHVHFLSTQGAHAEAAGEGVNIVNLLQSQWGHLFTNTEEFTGRPSVAPDGNTIVYATQENRQHILGHLTLLGLKEPVMPWCSDGPSEAELGGNTETTLSRWADACHQQGGTVVIPHAPNPNCEPAALIATGRADAYEFVAQDAYQHLEYYRYLNCGYRMSIVGGTDKMTSDVPVGIYRTYVHIPDDEPFTYDNWCKHLRAGNTFQTGGPLLRLTVEGQPIGSVVSLPGNGGTVEVAASADGVLPFQSLEIVMNGKVVARADEPNGTRHLRLQERIAVGKHSWIAARCAGANYWDSARHHDGWRRPIMAHTSPIYLAVGGEWWMFDLGAANYMLTLLHGGIEYIRQRSTHWEPKSVTHHHGREDHLEFLEEPFQQAIQAIHERMHALGIAH